MTPALSITPPAALTLERRACAKPILSFDPADEQGAARRAQLATDTRFFVTVWAMGFVLFYGFVF